MIKLLNPKSEIFYPNNPDLHQDLTQTTHLGIGAHPDDLEIIAIHGILKAHDNPNYQFTGVTVTDGRSAPRSGPFAMVSDDELSQIRGNEQRKAAEIGQYYAQFLLNYASQAIKSYQFNQLIEDLAQIITITSPQVIYTQNLADKHDTHVAVALAVIQALRQMDPILYNIKVYGCETWRSLDWLINNDKIAFDVSKHLDLQQRLLKVFKSQIIGGKQYDQPSLGRCLANATFIDSHKVYKMTHTLFAMDLTPLIHDPSMDIEHYMTGYIQNFAEDVRDRLNRLRRNST